MNIHRRCGNLRIIGQSFAALNVSSMENSHRKTLFVETSTKVSSRWIRWDREQSMTPILCKSSFNLFKFQLFIHFYVVLIDYEFQWTHKKQDAWIPFEVPTFPEGTEELAKGRPIRGLQFNGANHSWKYSHRTRISIPKICVQLVIHTESEQPRGEELHSLIVRFTVDINGMARRSRDQILNA